MNLVSSCSELTYSAVSGGSKENSWFNFSFCPYTAFTAGLVFWRPWFRLFLSASLRFIAALMRYIFSPSGISIHFFIQFFIPLILWGIYRQKGIYFWISLLGLVVLGPALQPPPRWIVRFCFVSASSALSHSWRELCLYEFHKLQRSLDILSHFSMSSLTFDLSWSGDNASAINLINAFWLM